MIQQDTHAHPLVLVSVAAPEDRALLTQWETHLRPLEQAGLISMWSEGHLAPGANRVQELQRHVDGVDLVVVLLSADFFSSPECLAMRDRALERAHEGKIQVIPLLLRPVAWQESSLDALAPWPPNGKPITLWGDQDEGWHACVQELRRLLGRRVSEALRSERSVKQADPDWDRMLRRLRESYKELRDQSLHGTPWMELGLTRRPDMVSNQTNLLYRFPNGGEQPLAPGTPIVDAYDKAVGELLILGAPGAGKSTLLLDLARQLVGRAFADPSYLLPIILRLSSWARQRPALETWMIEQLEQTYKVPSLLAERWVTDGRLLPLLDGLDEMEEAARPACIAAINTYHQTHLVPLVICSRQAEYEEEAAKRERLALQSAVIIQPLSEAQIEGYLSVAGPSFTGVRTALQQEHALRELATTPLMLSVLLLTYQGTAASEIAQRETELEQQVWTDYVARQVAEKGNDTRYPLERTRAFLSWLAQQMRQHQQTIFYAEYLQEDWLVHDQQRTVILLATRLPAILLGGCIGVLVSLLIGEYNSLEVLLQMGLLGGFVGRCLSLQPIGVRSQVFSGKQAHFRNALLLGLLVAASQGLALHPADPGLGNLGYFLNDWLIDGCVLGLGSLLSGWAFQGLLDRTPKQWVPVLYKHLDLRGRLATWMNAIAPFHIWQAALVFGGGMGLSYVSAVLRYEWTFGLSSGWTYALSDGLREGLSIGPNISVMVVLARAILANTVGSLRFAERIRWTWRGLFQPKHLRTSLIVAGILFLFGGLNAGLDEGLNNWPSRGLPLELSVALGVGLSAGLSQGLITGLIYWILLGLYQGMKQEHLENQDRQRFNQGIRRSLRNGLFISLLSALLISAIGVLDGGAILLLLPGMVVMWSLSGGLTVLRHYVIRWLLDRRHIFPWRAQTFLDDATARILLRRVGGGYSFIHRRLQDYFAGAALPMLPEMVAPLTPQRLMQPSLAVPVSMRKTEGKKNRCIELLCSVLIMLIIVGGIIGVATTATIARIHEGNATATATIARIHEGNATATAQIREGNATVLYPPEGKPPELDDPLRDNTKGHKWEEDTTSGDCKFIHGTFDVITPIEGFENGEWCPARGTDFTNFIYEVQMKIITGDSGGIAFRANANPDQSFYSFVINPNGTYSLNSNSSGIELAHGSSPAIHRGLKQTNLIAVVAHGSTLELYVNHTQIRVVHNTELTHGMIAVIVKPLKNQTEVIFQNAKVWVL